MPEPSISQAKPGMAAPEVIYEQLYEMQQTFEDAEMEVTRQQATIFAPAYTKRAALISQVPNFWPLVLENAPDEVEEFIRPLDSNVLAASLEDLSVSRFAIPPDGPAGKPGSPRSVAFTFRFRDSEWLEACVLTKKFWYRRHKDGWTGLVSEPVRVPFKKGKDLTGGLGEAAWRLWEAEKKGNGEKEKKRARELVEETPSGDISFFTWFYFRGRRVTEEESQAATGEWLKRWATSKPEIAKGKEGVVDLDEEDEGDGELDDEVFVDGDKLAIVLAEDIWPNAIDYYLQGEMPSDDDDDDDASSDTDGGDDEVVPELISKIVNPSKDLDKSGRPEKKLKT